MKVVVICSKLAFRNAETVAKLEEVGATFYESGFVDLSEVTELFGQEETVLAVDELQIKGGFQSINAMLPKLKSVKYICGLSSRYHELDLAEATNSGIIYCNNPGTTTESVAELALLHLLSITRNIPLHRRADFDFYGINKLGREYNSLSIGILGYGNIGQRIADICDTNGMKVCFWSRSKKQSKYQQTDLLTIIRQDVVMIVLPTTSETKELIGDNLVSKLLPHQYVVDVTASDSLYDKNLIIEMVNNGKLAGFGFEAETPASSYITSEGNVLVTPHVGWGTKESYQNMYSRWVDTIIAANMDHPINIAK